MKSAKGIRWTVEVAASEFGIDAATLSGRLKRAGSVPGADGMFSTREVADAVYGDYERERTRLTAAQADKAEIERARMRNEVMEVETVYRVWENVVLAIRRTILTCGLGDKEKDQTLDELRSLKIEDYLEQREFDQGAPSENAEPVSPA